MIYSKDELYNVLQYPRPRVTVDMVVFHEDRVLVQKRNIDPFKGLWCLPGGHVDCNEELEVAASRELKEEMGIDIPKHNWHMFKVYNDDKADPRGWRITFGMLAIVPDMVDIKVDEEECTDYKWVFIDDVPKLAFNHNEIVIDSCK